MKKTICVLTGMLVCLIMLSACAQETPQPHEAYYLGYLEMAKIDFSQAVRNYCHYELEENWEAALEDEGVDRLVEYEIYEWKQLSDKLWVVKVYMRTLGEERDVYNFVGVLDERFYVMPSVGHVPQELKEGLDLEPYKNYAQ